MECHEATFQVFRAVSDLEKYHARVQLHKATTTLDAVLSLAPGRFRAAKRDLLHSQATLQQFDASWKEDLMQRLSHRPSWIPDEFSRQCSHCQKPFTMMRGKHHCRACGLVFCDACTFILPSLPKLVHFTSKRVCAKCEKLHAPSAVRNLYLLQHFLRTVFPDLVY